MESAQRELACVLLEHLHALGLISGFTCSAALDLVHAGADLPELFQVPGDLEKEAALFECAQDPQ